MSGHIKASGAWKQVNGLHVKAGGAWKGVNKGYVRAGGVWKEFYSSAVSLMDIIAAQGLTSGLQLCLDAGAAVSYSSGQKWLDLSGNGQDFFRGADGSATATDPTFNGSAGALNTTNYFSSDGGDLFAYDSANETWMNNMHKDNAKFSAVFIYWPIASVNQFLFDSGYVTYFDSIFTFDFVTAPGAFIAVSGGNALQVQATGDTISAGAAYISTATITGSAWNFLGVSQDEASSTGLNLQINGTAESNQNLTYATPSTGAAAGATLGGARFSDGGSTVSYMPNGARLRAVAMWNTNIGATALANLRSALVAAGSFGL